MVFFLISPQLPGNSNLLLQPADAPLWRCGPESVTPVYFRFSDHWRPPFLSAESVIRGRDVRTLD